MSLTFFLWSFLVILAGKWWWRWCYGVGTVKGDERVIERSVCCMKKKRGKWVAGQESEDSCEMCGCGEWGRWGHTCCSLKYLLSFLLFFTHSWIELGHYKRCRVGSWLRKNGRKKRKRRRKRKGKWVGLGVGQGVNKYIKRIKYIWLMPVHNIVKIYCKNIVNIILFEKKMLKSNIFLQNLLLRESFIINMK